MADKISFQNGNFSGSNWKTVESTGTQATRTASTNTTTSYAYIGATGFTPTNGVVCEGVLLNVLRNNTTGTVSVSLLGSGSGTPLAEVTINTSDLPIAQSWVFFKFASTVTFNSALTYKVGIKGDTAGNAAFFRSATAADWARYFRTNSAASPSAADNFFIVGENLSAGSTTAIAITMDNTGSSTYGKFDIGNAGTFAYGTSSSTNYLLKCGGFTPAASQYSFEIWSGGTFNMGTSSSPMPSTSTAILEFQSASSGQHGIWNRGTFNTYGATKIPSALLNADVSASATSLTTNISTSWLSGDSIVVASTTRTPAQAELRTLSGDASGTSLSISSGLTNAHSGTGLYVAEIINLTRNVKIRGLSTTNTMHIYNDASSILNWRYTELSLYGANSANKNGCFVVPTAALSGSADIRYCSFYNGGTANTSALISDTASYDNVYYGYNVIYNFPTYCIFFGATTGSTLTIDNCNCISLNVGTNSALELQDSSVNVTNNITSSSFYGIRLSEASASSHGTHYNNIIHSNGSVGYFISGVGLSNLTLDTIKVWRCNDTGIYNIIGGNDFRFVNCSAYGNANSNFLIQGTSWNYLFLNCTLDAGVTLTSPIGINLNGSSGIFLNYRFINCSFGATGIHSTADIVCGTNCIYDLNLTNCIMTSSAEFSNYSNQREVSKIKALRHDQQATNHKTLYTYGTLSSDTTIYRSGAISERLTPNVSSTFYQKLESGPKRIKINSGTSATISCYVRKSATGAGDANTYSGNNPVLMMRVNPGLGITTDTVLATATSAANGAWELLSGSTGTVLENGVLEFYVICDGTVGWVNVDDWATT